MDHEWKVPGTRDLGPTASMGGLDVPYEGSTIGPAYSVGRPTTWYHEYDHQTMSMIHTTSRPGTVGPSAVAGGPWYQVRYRYRGIKYKYADSLQVAVAISVGTRYQYQVPGTSPICSAGW